MRKLIQRLVSRIIFLLLIPGFSNRLYFFGYFFKRRGFFRCFLNLASKSENSDFLSFLIRIKSISARFLIKILALGFNISILIDSMSNCFKQIYENTNNKGKSYPDGLSYLFLVYLIQILYSNILDYFACP